MLIAVQVKPGSSRTQVGGDHDGALIVRVTARAVDGKATEATLRALATALGVRTSALRLVTGAIARTKLIEVESDPRGEAQLALRVDQLRNPS